MPAEVLAIQPAAVRRPADVDALRAREEDHLPAGFAEPVAPVGLLAEQEVVLVALADLGDRLAPEQHARAHHDLHLAHLVVVEAAAVEGVKRGGSGSQLAEEEVLGREPPDRRIAADRPLQRSVGIDEARADGGCPRPRVREGTEPLERALRQPGVGIEEQHVRARGLADPEVPARAEPAVLELHHTHVGKARPHERDGAVARAVVDDHRVGTAKRVQAVLDPRQRVVRDDDGCYGRIRHARLPAARRPGGRPGA